MRIWRGGNSQLKCSETSSYRVVGVQTRQGTTVTTEKGNRRLGETKSEHGGCNKYGDTDAVGTGMAGLNVAWDVEWRTGRGGWWRRAKRQCVRGIVSGGVGDREVR